MQIRSEFHRLGRNVASLLYQPIRKSSKAAIGILIMHSDADYLTFPMGAEMARRGYTTLCANVSDKGLSLDRKLLDLKLVVEFLKSYSGIRKVVLMGHSGGGTLVSAYQNLAENGVQVFQGPEKLVKCSDSLSGLPSADGLMLLDSNYGIAAMSLFSLDPAILDESSGKEIDPAKDLFNCQNGYHPFGARYGLDFVRLFQKSQGERNNRLISAALERKELLDQGLGRFEDDEPFIVPGGAQVFVNNKLYAQDTSLMSHTVGAWPLVRADGSTFLTQVRSVRKSENPHSFTGSYLKGALTTTVRTYLNSYAVRTTPDYGYDGSTVFGIDWESNYNCPPGNMSGIQSPLLVMGMTGNWEYLASELIYEKATACDKQLAFVEGASHLFTTATNCENFPGEFGDTQKTTFDFVDRWLSECGRFL